MCHFYLHDASRCRPPSNESLDYAGHFDTKITIIAQIEQILQESKDPKIDNILNLERVYFLVTRVIYSLHIYLLIATLLY